MDCIVFYNTTSRRPPIFQQPIVYLKTETTCKANEHAFILYPSHVATNLLIKDDWVGQLHVVIDS